MTQHDTELVFQYRQAEYDVDPVYLRRWSPRSFSEREVPLDTLMSLFEAARWAPSANNEQPWRFIVARTEEERKLFYSFIHESNRVWCENAPALVAVASVGTSSRGTPNRTHAFDAGAAWGLLALEAVRKGLITHAMGGFDREKARLALGVPDDVELHAIVAIGYRGPKETLPPHLQEREKPSSRKSIRETVFFGLYGRTDCPT